MITFAAIGKKFPGVAALDDVSFTIERGQCHALLGENGAGKSTLGKLLAGIYRPDAGEILIEGKPVVFRTPREATQAGVAIVHQELVFCPNLSVAENLCLADLPRKGWWFDRTELNRRARALLAQLEVEIDVELPLARLSIAQEQMVQIAAAVGLNARIIVFDEPTSSLGDHEVQQLFRLIRRLLADGVTIIYVSHRLEEIFALCDAVTVLRDGKHVATVPIAEVDHDKLVTMMVGRKVEHFSLPLPAPADAARPPRLAIADLSSAGHFEHVSLEVQPGEVVGLAGLVGAGRTEVLEAIFGLDRTTTGTIHIDGQPVSINSPRAACLAGIGLVPEDRKRQGLILEMTVGENTSLSILDRLRGWLGAIRRGEEQRIAADYRERLRIRTSSLDVRAVTLSGGNQQKIVLAKWMATGGRVLLIDEPTRGVDVGAKREIHELIGELAAAGLAVLVVSSDLPELLALAHRLVILREGKQVATLDRHAADAETVLRYMAGLKA